MPKPFPLPYNVGLDICHVARITRLLRSGPPSIRFPGREIVNSGPDAPNQKDPPSRSKTKSSNFSCRQRFLTRIFNYYERRYYMMLEECNNVWSRREKLSQKENKFVAGRFAAKEAIIKAVRHRRISFHDIIILPSEIEYPSLQKRESHSMDLSPGSKAPRAVVLAERQDVIDVNGTVRRDIFKLRSPETISYMSRCASKARVYLEDFEEETRRWEEGEEVNLNISHDGDYAIAVCLASTPSSYSINTAEKGNKYYKTEENKFSVRRVPGSTFSGGIEAPIIMAPLTRKILGPSDLPNDDYKQFISRSSISSSSFPTSALNQKINYSGLQVKQNSTKDAGCQLKPEQRLRQLLPEYFTHDHEDEVIDSSSIDLLPSIKELEK